MQANVGMQAKITPANRLDSLTKEKNPEMVQLPANVEAEQALIGAIMLDNELLDRVGTFLEPEHFFLSIHGRLFDAMQKRFKGGQDSSPITLKGLFESDEALIELGGPDYLIQLAGSAVSLFAAPDYARLISEAALRRSLMALGDKITINAKQQDSELSPEEQIVEAERDLYSLAEHGGRDNRSFISFAGAVTRAIEDANRAYLRDDKLAGISSGLRDLDHKLGGFHSSDLIIIAGRPSMGKTALATNIAFSIARTHREGELPDGSSGTVDGGVVGFFSLEMSSEQLATRIISEQSGIASDKVRRGDLSDRQFQSLIETAQTLENIPLYIDDTPALSIEALSSRARRLKRSHGLDILIVDYLQLARANMRLDYGRVQEVSEITQGLKAIAKDLQIPVIALSQLSRQVEMREDRRPQLADLRESGSIEQDADVVLFVFREEYYLKRREPHEGTAEHIKWQDEIDKVYNLAELIIGKQRHGPIGTVKLQFESNFTRFYDRADEAKIPDPIY